MNRHAMVGRMALGTLLLGALLGAPRTSNAGTVPRALDPLVQNMDLTVKPGDDFFKYSCGRWLKSHPIPAAERGWGIGNLVHEETYRQLRGICESAARSGAARGTVDQKVGDFWTSGMDSLSIEKAGAAPLRPFLDEVAAIRTRDDVLRAVAHFQRLGFGSLFSLYVGQDERHSERYALHLFQGGLGLPDRDYYFNSDTGTVRIRREYRKHVAAMFALLGNYRLK